MRIALVPCLVALLLSACRAPAPAHDALATPAPAVLPAGVSSCAVLDEVNGAQRCRVFDTRAKAFLPTDSFTARVYRYDRWLDLYNTVEKQVVVRNLNQAMQPGDPESHWSDEKYINYWDDFGDSAGMGEMAQISAAFRYAVTGIEADYQRLESYIRGAVGQFDATGVDGYLARFRYAGVAAGTPILNGHAMGVRANDVNNAFDIPASQLPLMPSYFKDGLEIGGAHVDVQPTWAGHPSIDSYSGPMHAWPIAFSLIRDPALKARMAVHFGCFLKRLRIFKIINLSKNAALQAEVAKYLTTGVLHLDADDPDLTKTDQVWAFYLPQLNKTNVADYPRQCPAQLAQDATADETVDVTVVGWEAKLLTFFSRSLSGTDRPDSMDFAYFVSVRAGDAIMLQAYALAAYRLTGDAAYLRWRDQVVIGKGNAKEVGRTTGAFIPPKFCRSYYRTPGVYAAHFSRLLTDGDPDSHAFAVDLWRRKFAGKELAGLGDPRFEVMFAAALSERTPGVVDALAQLAAFGGTAELLDDPRRNYSSDATLSPPPGITIAPSSDADIKLCTAPITVLGVTIPTGDPTDVSELFADHSLPLMRRPPDNWQWEKDPYRAVRKPGDAGRQQYAGLDLTEPYWIARYFKLLPDAHAVLAWGPNE